MANGNLGCTIFAIAAIILAVSTVALIKPEHFSEVMDSRTNQIYTPGNSISNTVRLENYQDNLIMNIGTDIKRDANGTTSFTGNVNKQGAEYYKILSDYLAPDRGNLERASNIMAGSIMAGPTLRGQPESYSNANGDGYVNNLGYLEGIGSFPPVAYKNERASQLSKCAKDLPMFAASSLLPKPSVNADNNALSQSAARALAAFTNLSSVEQIGAITRTGHLPYGSTTSERPPPSINQKNIFVPVFNASPFAEAPASYGNYNSTTLQPGQNQTC